MQVKSKANTPYPGVIFLSGFHSDMTGSKATHLAAYAKTKGCNYVRFDYHGTGQSSGNFKDGTISRWLEDVLQVIDELTSGPQIVVGSSMGGWLMLLAALQRPERIAGLVGIASAPDFTEELLWDSFTQEQQQILQSQGEIDLAADECGTYIITRGLIEDGRKHMLLDKAGIPLSCPVRLLHGMQDTDVPYQTSLRIAERLHGQDAHVTLVKNGDHRMSAPAHLQTLAHMLDTILASPLPSININ